MTIIRVVAAYMCIQMAQFREYSLRAVSSCVPKCPNCHVLCTLYSSIHNIYMTGSLVDTIKCIILLLEVHYEMTHEKNTRVSFLTNEKCLLQIWRQKMQMCFCEIVTQAAVIPELLSLSYLIVSFKHLTRNWQVKDCQFTGKESKMKWSEH